MEKSAHYSATYFLMRALSFPPSEAWRIAYASQYTDDAVESEPLTLDDGTVVIDPIRTAHYGLHITKKKLNELAQKIWMPFHFLPGNIGATPAERLVTRPGSQLALFLINRAFAGKDKPFFLHALGIATHSFLDTFSHQGFSGRRGKENHVDDLHADFDIIGALEDWKSRYKESYPFEIAGLAPEIGHAEALVFPDLPFLTWSYDDWKENAQHVFNPTRFYDAFRTALEVIGAKKGIAWENILRLWRGDGTSPHSGIYGVLKSVFTQMALTEEERMKAWKKILPKQTVFAFDPDLDKLYLDYDKDQWLWSAVYKTRGMKRDDLLAGGAIKPADDFETTDFYLFHQAAKAQREFVENYLVKNQLF